MNVQLAETFVDEVQKSRGVCLRFDTTKLGVRAVFCRLHQRRRPLLHAVVGECVYQPDEIDLIGPVAYTPNTDK